MSADGGLPPGPVVVLGTGRAGLSAVAALTRAGAEPIRVWDAHDAPITRERRARLLADGADVRLGSWSDALLQGPGEVLVVKSPGVPAGAAPVVAARARGLPVIDELELGVRLTRRDLLAVTGTDGKSTTCAFLACSAGDGLPLAGNTEFGDPLSALPPAGGPVVLEVSSFQLEFTRPAFARLAVLTALSEDHLDRHGTMGSYAAAKRRLFLDEGRAVPAAVINVDGPFGRLLARDLRAAGAAVAAVGVRHGADYRVIDVRNELRACAVRALTPSGETTFTLRMPGRHNAENALAALAGCDLLGVPRDRALDRLSAMPGVPGRWDVVGSASPVDVVVDFAHAPSALRRTLGCAREILADRPGGALHTVLSAGGRTAMGKRRRFGRVAGDLADRVIVTEGSMGERPQEEIIAAAAAGARAGRAQVMVEPDRRAAIRRAVADAVPGDLVVIVGHGARPRLYTDPAGGGRPFDDRVVAREALEDLVAPTRRAAPTRRVRAR
jgi:UDP-N-acetylmuramoyl-L-alanyl-D-glutamate--2,6-diaminopimelate ligase